MCGAASAMPQTAALKFRAFRLAALNFVFSPFFPSFEDSEAVALSRESLRSVAFKQKNGHDDKPFITLYDEK